MSEVKPNNNWRRAVFSSRTKSAKNSSIKMWGFMIYCHDNMSMSSTRDKNVSKYVNIMDMLCGRVHGMDTNLIIEIAAVADRLICANMEDIGYGG